MKTEKCPLYVKFRPNLNLIAVSTDAGNGKGEQTIMTLSPTEAFNLGKVLVDMGIEHGANRS